MPCKERSSKPGLSSGKNHHAFVLIEEGKVMVYLQTLAGNQWKKADWFRNT